MIYLGERIVTHVETSHQGLKTEVSGKTIRYYKELKMKNDELSYTCLSHIIKRKTL